MVSLIPLCYRARLMKLLRTAALLLVCAAPGAHAMVVVQRDFPELVARAEQIVAGTVTDSQHETDAAGAPVTLVTFSDLTVLKGDVGDTLTLRFYGGEAGDVVVHIPDMPTFAIGDRAVLFVAGNGRDVCPLVGVWQGRFNVRFDAARQTDVVETNDHTPVVAIAGRQIVRGAAAAAPTGSASMPLNIFLDAIAGELAHPAISATPAR
jgi:hypothetical protein